jgi:hypothetical protein
MFEARHPSGWLFLLMPVLALAVSAQTLPTTTVSEVRWSDVGWGSGNDRNLVGRFTSQTFTVPRLSRVQTVYLRQFDSSMPPKSSRFTTALHLDYPLPL